MRTLSSLWFLVATVRHKRFVYQAGRRLGVARWQLVLHDLSKFRPSEFVPYGRFFYAAPGATWRKAVPQPHATPEMREAWLRHIQRNAHHWQHWVLIKGGSVVSRLGGASQGVKADIVEALPMPERYVREMLADWMGVARAYHGAYPESIETWAWWQQNRDQLVLHDETRRLLAAAVEDWFRSDQVSSE
jgi:uncharacterized protein DUF5662